MVKARTLLRREKDMVKTRESVIDVLFSSGYISRHLVLLSLAIASKWFILPNMICITSKYTLGTDVKSFSEKERERELSFSGRLD